MMLPLVHPRFYQVKLLQRFPAMRFVNGFLFLGGERLGRPLEESFLEVFFPQSRGVPLFSLYMSRVTCVFMPWLEASADIG